MTSSDWDRAVPHDLQAERAVLGSLLVAPEGLGEVAAVLAVEDFYRAAHRHVYVAIRELAEQGRAVDLLTVRDQLRARGWLDEVGPAYLASLVDGVPRTLNRSFYAGIVRTHADRARLMRLARRLLVDAADVECDVGEVLAAAQRDVGRLAQQRDVAGGRVPNHVSHISEVMEEVVEALRAGPPSFVDTPYPALTSMLGGGIAPGELAFLGARPGLGKTAMALEIARRAGKKGTSVFVVSREMLTLALGMRMLSQEGPVHATTLRKRDLSPQHWSTIDLAVESLSSLPIFLTHAKLDVDEIRRIVAIFAGESPLGLLVVDYLQLIDAPPGIKERRQQVEAVSAGLKAITLDFGIPVLCLSSLSRPPDGRRPTLASLRESGNLEHDADTVILLHREDELDPTTEVIVAKSRNGRHGMVELHFRGEHLRFEERVAS
ncbi:MAG TPA: DnaB-like helicase C-terminal domain-containing protein [Vicinamibacterales bacterium]|nr:DnaB-like helicase C-terminal domain-containing protein [Vicinamibacterales bacterium]